MASYRKIIHLFALIVFIGIIAGCGGREAQRIEGIKQQITLQYNAELRIQNIEGEGLALDATQIYDISTRISEGHRIVGVRIGDKKIKYEVIGAKEYEYLEEQDSVRLKLDVGQEYLPDQAGRFRLRLTSDTPLTRTSSGVFRKKLTFTPTPVWALVEDAKSPDGFTPIELNEPDLGYITLHTTGAFGEKQPPGGSRARDRMKMVYEIPSDITTLQPLTFTYFPSRSQFYFGTALTWIITRLLWMLLGIVLYVWWLKSRKEAKKHLMTRKRDAKKEPHGQIPHPPKEPEKS